MAAGKPNAIRSSARCSSTRLSLRSFSVVNPFLLGHDFKWFIFRVARPDLNVRPQIGQGGRGEGESLKMRSGNVIKLYTAWLNGEKGL